jgi:hypothetical protein
LALSFREQLTRFYNKESSSPPISDDYLPSMGKPVLSISGNVYKQQETEIDKVD